MSEINDGGGAFPSVLQYFPEDTNYRIEQGMTLRDYFAAKAMQAILSKVVDRDGSLTAHGLTCSTDDAYFIADEMLRARVQP
jgi:hypothetical protein